MFAIAEMGVGGAETMVEDLANAALDRGDEVAVVTTGGFRADRLASRGAVVASAPMRERRPVDLARAVRIARRAVRRRRPELVHVHNVKAALVMRLATAGRRVRTVVTLHGVPDGEYDAAARLLRRAADLVVAVSPHVSDELVRRGFSADRVRVIENAVHRPVAHDQQEARAQLGIDPGVAVAVMIARLVDQKRHDLAVAAWAAVPQPAVLLIVGDGPNRDRIAAQVSAAGLQHRVRLLGARTDVDRLLAAADVSILPTNWEGLPISILEAMAAGVPVVASAVAGLTETLEDAALLVEPGSSTAVAEGVMAVLSDPELARRLRRAGRELVERRFGAARMIAEYQDTYAELLNS